MAWGRMPDWLKRWQDQDLWAAIRARDIAGLREDFGEKIYIATRP